ncbi:MAG TPA: LacI family DNA-binding transcriptional regulator [Actinomycetota bacterium]|jgi:DNA-binding LacI/PurR family transcriptional regulator|nr:LacI family DNA-binding transcriptional regulator [Actinomycetota bacterium]
MARRGHVGIRDVARAAGVSITTVSHALNEKGGVSEETRKRVRAVAEELGYRPDPRGRQLASGRTGLVALTVSLPDGVHVLVEEFAHHADLIDAATKAAVARGLALVVVPAGDSTIWERLPLDGTIVVDPLPDDLAVGEMRNRKRPIVTVGRLPGGGVDTLVVDSDYEGGTSMMLDHLVESGARRVGIIAAGTGESYETDTLAAYRRWCADHEMEPWITSAGDIDWSSPRAWAQLETIGRSTAAACLDREDVPDALYCLAEAFAVGVLTECTARGLDVPGDVMVASMSDRGVTSRTQPPLTTLDLHPRHLGTVAAQVLADLVEGVVADPEPVTVPVTLITRQSTARS